jgi:putative peptidoglycan lipid II flippase
MFPFLLCVSLAALLMGALNTKKVFFVPALAPAMLNVTLILSIVFFESRTSQPIIAAAIGVLAGGFVQFAFQLPSFSGMVIGLANPSFRHSESGNDAPLVPATLALSSVRSILL